MDLDALAGTCLNDGPNTHELPEDPLSVHLMDTCMSPTTSVPDVSDSASASVDITDHEQEATLVDVRETTESFTTNSTDQPTVSCTPPSHSILYEPKTTLGKQVAQLLGDRRLTQKFDKLQLPARDCEKGDSTHKRYEGTAAKVKQGLIDEYNRHKSDFNFGEQGYIVSHNKHKSRRYPPPEMALAMRKRRISTIVHHEWKLKLS